MKTETNFIEILLKNAMVGMTIYNDNGDAITIGNINYDPITEHVFIQDQATGHRYKLSIKKNFDFDYTTITKIAPDSGKIKGKRDR